MPVGNDLLSFRNLRTVPPILTEGLWQDMPEKLTRE